jgi:carboxylate-amine ligase
VEIGFAANDAPTLGIELELTLVDDERRALASEASTLLHELAAGRPEGHPKAKHELFECTVEIITDVCTTVGEARADLSGSLSEVQAAASRHGLSVVSSGTHPFSSWRDQLVSPSARYQELIAELQWTARRLAIFGVHFHVAVGSGERAVAIANALREHLPLLLALSASSPSWEGEDTGLASSRSKVFETLPTAGLNPHLDGWAEFETLMGTLVAAECIRTVREIWWDVRPHPDFGTVELRMCDAPPTLREVAALAALAQSLVVWLDQDVTPGATPGHDWTVRENKWLAARHGIEARLIADHAGTRRSACDLAEELLTRLGPTASALGCTSELDDVRRILDHGPSYRRQRAIRHAGGTAQDVVDALIRELRTDEPVGP